MTLPAVDFLPPAFRERRLRRRAWATRAVLSGVLVLIAGGASFAVGRQSDRMAARLEETRRKYDLARGRIAQVEQLDRKKQELSQRLEVLKDVLARARGARTVAALGVACPDEVVLEKVAVRVDESGVRPHVELTIEGRAERVDAVMNLIDRLEEVLEPEWVHLVESADLATRDALKAFIVIARLPGLVPVGGVP